MAWFIPDQVPLPREFLGFDPQSALVQNFHIYQRHLPHWRAFGRCYFITFRLRDSIPAELMEEMKTEAQEWQHHLAKAARDGKGCLPPEMMAEWQKFQQVQMRKLEAILDEGRGECLLRLLVHRQPLMEALHHFHGTRCEMLAYVIMPNHAHVLCRPLGAHSPESLSRA